MALYNCPECGREISDTVKKCPHCGFSLKKNQKKKIHVNKKLLSAMIVFCVIMVGCIVLVYILKPSDSEKILKYIESGKYEKANTIYQKVSGNSIKAKEIEDDIISKIDDIYLSFKLGKTLEDDANKQINEIKAMSISDRVLKKASEVETGIQRLSASIVAYKKGNDFHEKKEYMDAISSYEKVIEEDTNYSDAQLKMEEDKNVLIEQYVQTAEQYYKSKEYTKAVAEIDKAIRYDDSTKNKSLKEKYQSAVIKKENKEKALKKGESFKGDGVKVTFNKAELTYKLLPENQSGYYTYYSAQKSEIFYAMKFTVKNTSEREVLLEDIIDSMTVTYDDKYTYDSFSIYYIDEDGSIDYAYSWDNIEPLRSVTLYVEIDLPEKVKKTKKKIVTDITIAGKEKRYVYR